MASEKPRVGDLISLAQESRKAFNSSSTRAASGSSLANSSNQPQLLVRAPAGRVVSLWACTKISLLSFGVGIVVGFMLKTRVRRWAAKLLKKIRDD